MSHHSQLDIMMLWEVFLICLSIWGIWKVYNDWQARKKFRKQIPLLEEQFIAAADEIDKLFSNDFYFSFRDEILFTTKYSELRKLVPSGFDRLGLTEALTGHIARFASCSVGF